MLLRSRPPYIASRRHALILGYAGIIIGAAALYDAYENRRQRRPFATKLLPGG